MTIKLFMDEPVKQAIASEKQRGDELGFNLYAEKIALAVTELEGPFTIGIFGEWGSGKTSLMHLIEKQFEDDVNQGKHLTVWFNAWQYEKEEELLIPLIAKIKHEIENNSKFLDRFQDSRRDIVNYLKSIARCLTVAAEVSFPVKVKLSFNVANFFNRPLDERLNASVFENVLGEFEKLNFGDSRIIVFLDDLDRCLPDNALKLLENIKYILGQKGFIFIIGVSRDGIEKYLSKKYTEEYGMDEQEFKNYLHKIIQLEFPVPEHNERIQKYTDSLIGRMSEEHQKELKELSGLINRVCECNPRTILRLLNSVNLNSSIYSATMETAKESSVSLSCFVVATMVNMLSPKAYKLLVRSDKSREIVAKWKKREDVDNFLNIEEKTLSTEKEKNQLKNTGNNPASKDINTAKKVAEYLMEAPLLAELLLESGAGKKWLKEKDCCISSTMFLLSKKSVKASDMKLLHASWRAENRDKEFGSKMYRFDALIDAEPEILDQIESVTYHLHPTFPKNNQKQERSLNFRDDYFRLKELHYGEFNLKAEVKIFGQEQPIWLNRRITKGTPARETLEAYVN